MYIDLILERILCHHIAGGYGLSRKICAYIYQIQYLIDYFHISRSQAGLQLASNNPAGAEDS